VFDDIVNPINACLKHKYLTRASKINEHNISLQVEIILDYIFFFAKATVWQKIRSIKA